MIRRHPPFIPQVGLWQFICLAAQRTVLGPVRSEPNTINGDHHDWTIWRNIHDR
jgi:hypothetical protein